MNKEKTAAARKSCRRFVNEKELPDREIKQEPKELPEPGIIPEGGCIPEEDGFYTYILRCADGTCYTGWTTNLIRRLAAHNQGTGSRYTRSRRPVELAWFETFSTKEEAMSREWHIKQLTRRQKIELIASAGRRSS